MNQKKRDRYCVEILHAITLNSTCLTRQVGALIVNEQAKIYGTGYNGTPIGIANCNEGGCQRCADRIAGKVKSGEGLEYCVCCHAEENAILFATGRLKGKIMYTQWVPCSSCARKIINVGIKEVVCLKDDYADKMGGELLRQAGIKIRVIAGQ